MDAKPLPANIRMLLSLHAGFFLNCVRTVAMFEKGDLMRGLVYTAIWLGNVEHLAPTDGPLGAEPPDAMRKPVSVRAVARALRLPYETTRRYANGLVSEGVCKRVAGQGLIVPAAVLESPAEREKQSNVYALIAKFAVDLRDAGLVLDEKAA